MATAPNWYAVAGSPISDRPVLISEGPNDRSPGRCCDPAAADCRAVQAGRRRGRVAAAPHGRRATLLLRRPRTARCRLAVSGHEPIMLTQGRLRADPRRGRLHVLQRGAARAGALYRAGHARWRWAGQAGCTSEGPRDVLFLVGHCTFGSPDAALLVSLLPQVVHVRGEARLATLVELVGQETRATRPARNLVLARLLEVLLIEALRSTPATAGSPGLLLGLADPRLAAAIRRMHERPGHAWTIAELAGAAALSRSTFFDRFRRAVGAAPMDYLLTWRMALAQNLLRRRQGSIAEIARARGLWLCERVQRRFRSARRHAARPVR